MGRYIIRILAGWTVWAVLLAIYYSYQFWGRGLVPKVMRDAVEFAMGLVGFAAWPMALGGWLMWGEGWWIFSLPANIAVGLMLYAVLGLVVGAVYGRLRKQPSE